MENLYLTLALAPLVGAVIAGLFGKKIGRAGAHWVTTLGVAVSFALSVFVFNDVIVEGAAVFNGTV
ncbi:NADH-ubiquinone oxidoreductase chain L, partial [hydrothermal vent metagenome]